MSVGDRPEPRATIAPRRDASAYRASGYEPTAAADHATRWRELDVGTPATCRPPRMKFQRVRAAQRVASSSGDIRRWRRSLAACRTPASASSLLLRHIEIRQRARKGLRRHGEGLRQRRMRMDRQADVLGVAAHLDRQRGLRDEVAGVAGRRCRSRSAGRSPRPTASWSGLRRGRATASARSPPRGTPPCRI